MSHHLLVILFSFSHSFSISSFSLSLHHPFTSISTLSSSFQYLPCSISILPSSSQYLPYSPFPVSSVTSPLYLFLSCIILFSLSPLFSSHFCFPISSPPLLSSPLLPPRGQARQHARQMLRKQATGGSSLHVKVSLSSYDPQYLTGPQVRLSILPVN